MFLQLDPGLLGFLATKKLCCMQCKCPCKAAHDALQLRGIMQKKLTTSVEEDASVSEHYNEVCKREARVRMLPLIIPKASTVLWRVLLVICYIHVLFATQQLP